jgi:hypothetical protein
MLIGYTKTRTDRQKPGSKAVKQTRQTRQNTERKELLTKMWMDIMKNQGANSTKCFTYLDKF